MVFICNLNFLRSFKIFVNSFHLDELGFDNLLIACALIGWMPCAKFQKGNKKKRNNWSTFFLWNFALNDDR